MSEKILRISSSISSWLAPTLHGTAADTDQRMIDVRDKILARDNFSCHFCNFKSEEYQEIHMLNGDHNDFSESNLTTICPLCHQAFHLSTCSQSTGGSIIVLKSMTQIELNNLCRFLFIARASGVKEWVTVSKQIYDIFRTNETIVEQQISPKGSDPIIFAQVLQNLPRNMLNEKYMESFKLLPKFNRFEKAVEYWKDNVTINMPVEKWKTLIPDSVDFEK